MECFLFSYFPHHSKNQPTASGSDLFLSGSEISSSGSHLMRAIAPHNPLPPPTRLIASEVQ